MIKHNSSLALKNSSSMANAIRSSAFVLIATILMACQGETVAQTQVETVAETQVEAATQQVEAAAQEVAEQVEAAAQLETATEAQVETPAQVETSTEDQVEAAAKVETVAQPPLDASKYTDVKNPMKPSTGEKIEVMELFWYGCGHCYALEPSVKRWKANKPENAEFVKVPALFSKRWEFHGQAYYTMEALGVLEEASEKFFEEIHIRRRQINNLSQLTEFLARFDKSADEVSAAFNSFGVDSKMRAARKITRDSGATGVPTILVDGKYMTSETLTGGSIQLFNVVDQLVDKAASER